MNRGIKAVAYACCAIVAAVTTAAAGGRVNAPQGTGAFRRPATVPFPADNPYSGEKAELGRRLFFDPRLSGDGSRACADCHIPEQGWEDGLARGTALDGTPLQRRVPTIANAAWGETFFWDGRAQSLEEQALGPVQSHREMNQTLDGMTTALIADASVRQAFATAFPEAPEVTPENVARALATFERTVVSPRSAFDRWAEGDAAAISASAKRGFSLFVGKAGCANCHSGWAFSDQAFHDIGLPDDDRGRGKTLSQPELEHAFKTPTLRGLAHRGPYMHDGSLPSLGAVIEHYAANVIRRETLSPELPRIDLGQREKRELIAFLETLSADGPAVPLETVIPEPHEPVPTVAATEIRQKGKRFAPGHVTIAAGRTVKFLNDDDRTHNIRIHDPDLEFNSGMQDPGVTAEVSPRQPGTYFAFCGIHPKMKLVIEVTAVD